MKIQMRYPRGPLEKCLQNGEYGENDEFGENSKEKPKGAPCLKW